MTDEPTDVDAAPATPTVYLHIGTLKTGTSFLQRTLQRNADRLRREGVLFPLDSGRWSLQVRAARDVLDIKGRPVAGAWMDLVGQVHAWPGRASVVSMEFLSLASATRVQTIARSLAPANLQVLITARDLGRVIPSAWQSMIKQGDPWSFDEFAAAVTGNGEVAPEAHRRFWRHHDLVAIAGRWSEAVGSENVTVVTVPPRDTAEATLWERFATVIGVTPERYAVAQGANSNPSLTLEDAELMRQVSATLREELGRVEFKRWATDYFANRVLRAAPEEAGQHDGIQLGVEHRAWALERSQQLIDGLSTLGINVVGDLADLLPVFRADVSSTGDAAESPASTDASGTAESPGTVPYPEGTAEIVAALLRRIAAVDPDLPARARRNEDFQDPDDAADADEAAELAAGAESPAARTG